MAEGIQTSPLILWIPRSCWLMTIQHTSPQCISIFKLSMNSLYCIWTIQHWYFPNLPFSTFPFLQLDFSKSCILSTNAFHSFPYCIFWWIPKKYWIRTIHASFISFWPCQRNLIKTLQNEAITPLITKSTLKNFLTIFRPSY